MAVSLNHQYFSGTIRAVQNSTNGRWPAQAWFGSVNHPPSGRPWQPASRIRNRLNLIIAIAVIAVVLLALVILARAWNLRLPASQGPKLAYGHGKPVRRGSPRVTRRAETQWGSVRQAWPQVWGWKSG